MVRRLLLTFLIFVMPTAVWAQASPDRLLPSGSHLYMRWDGFSAHKEAYAKSAFGKTMQGDTGKFLGALWTYLLETGEALAAQADPNLPETIKEVNNVLGSIGQNGFAFGLEVGAIVPPNVQTVLVFPKSGPVLMPLVKKLTALGKAEIKEAKVGKRTIYTIGEEGVSVGYWSEGDDAVLYIGTGPAEAYAKRIDDKETGLAKNQVFQKVSNFKEFPIWARAYLDLDGVWKAAAAASPQAGDIIDGLGLKGLTTITFVSGFDGPAERAFTDFHISGERKGLLALLNKKKITLADLPPLPNDVTSFSASNFDLKNLYEGGLQIAEVATRVIAPNQGIDVREAVKQIEGIVGIKFGEELFGAFDGMSVRYSSGSEGLLGFGSVLMLKVKDEKKLLGALDTLFKGIPALPGIEIDFTKKDYRGVGIHHLAFKANGAEASLAYFTVHKGWFLYSSTPQPLYGFVLRSKGELDAWKADAKLLKQLEAFPKDFTGISVSDPRPGLQFLLATTPTLLSITNAFAGQLGQLAPGFPNLKTFDLTLIPHAQEATRHLFPNISVTTDDGKRIRIETRASLAIPFLN